MNTGRHFENLAHLLYGLFGLLLILIGLLINLSFSSENETESSPLIDSVSTSENVKLPAEVQLGKQLFKNKCAACHAKNMKAKLTGPPLAGVEDRWESKDNLYAWIKNSLAYLETGDAYAIELYSEYGKLAMTAFPELENEDIDAILAYINSVSKP